MKDREYKRSRLGAIIILVLMVYGLQFDTRAPQQTAPVKMQEVLMSATPYITSPNIAQKKESQSRQRLLRKSQLSKNPLQLK